MRYAYNGFLRLVGSIEDDNDCPAGCEATDEEPPAAPYPDGHWPHFIDDQWELVEVVSKLAG